MRHEKDSGDQKRNSRYIAENLLNRLFMPFSIILCSQNTCPHRQTAHEQIKYKCDLSRQRKCGERVLADNAPHQVIGCTDRRQHKLLKSNRQYKGKKFLVKDSIPAVLNFC